MNEKTKKAKVNCWLKLLPMLLIANDKENVVWITPAKARLVLCIF